MSMYDKLGDLLKKMDSVDSNKESGEDKIKEKKKEKEKEKEKEKKKKTSKKRTGKSSSDSKSVSHKRSSGTTQRKRMSGSGSARIEISEVKALKSDLKDLDKKVSFIIDILTKQGTEALGRDTISHQNNNVPNASQQMPSGATGVEQSTHLGQSTRIGQPLFNPDGWNQLLNDVDLSQFKLAEQRIDWYKVVEAAISRNYMRNIYTYTRFLELLKNKSEEANKSESGNKSESVSKSTATKNKAPDRGNVFSNIKEKWNRLLNRSVYLKKFNIDWSDENSITKKIGNTTRDILDLFYINGNLWLTSLEIFNILNQKDSIVYDSTHPKKLGLRRVRNVLNRLKNEAVIEKKREKDGRFYFRLI